MEVVDFWENFSLKDYKDLENFREIDIVREIPLYETNLYLEYYIYVNNIKSTYLYDDTLKKAMKASNMRGYSKDSEVLAKDTYEESTFSQYRSAFLYFSYQEMTGKKINNNSEIIEIGAGCGDFCKFIFDLGYRGNFTIVDIPETLPLSKKNLEGYPVNFTTTLPEVNNTFLISTWGLSETQINSRPDLSKCSGYLLTYQREIWNLNNEKYFSQYPGFRRDLSWLPWDKGSELLVL